MLVTSTCWHDCCQCQHLGCPCEHHCACRTVALWHLSTYSLLAVLLLPSTLMLHKSIGMPCCYCTLHGQCNPSLWCCNRVTRCIALLYLPAVCSLLCNVDSRCFIRLCSLNIEYSGDLSHPCSSAHLVSRGHAMPCLTAVTHKVVVTIVGGQAYVIALAVCNYICPYGRLLDSW